MLIKITIAENVRGFNQIFIFVYKSEVWEKFLHSDFFCV